MPKLCPECHHSPSERIADCGGYSAQCYCKCHDVADAGPELLEACEEIYEALWSNKPHKESQWQGHKDKLSAAIAKAKGETAHA